MVESLKVVPLDVVREYINRSMGGRAELWYDPKLKTIVDADGIPQHFVMTWDIRGEGEKIEIEDQK